MSSISDGKTISVPGFAGKRKTNLELIIQASPNKNKGYISVVRDNGTHVSSYQVSFDKLTKIVNENWWVWQDRNFN
jgi:hypothetical protein